MKKTVLTVVALAATSTIAFAQAPQGHDHPPGKDGKRGEFLLKADADVDGSVTPSEWKAFIAGKSAEQFKRLDKDGDGKLSPEEFAAVGDRGDKGFQRLDVNKDGVINKADRDALKKFRGEHGNDVPPPPPPGGPGDPGAKPPAE